MRGMSRSSGGHIASKCRYLLPLLRGLRLVLLAQRDPYPQVREHHRALGQILQVSERDARLPAFFEKVPRIQTVSIHATTSSLAFLRWPPFSRPFLIPSF